MKQHKIILISALFFIIGCQRNSELPLHSDQKNGLILNKKNRSSAHRLHQTITDSKKNHNSSNEVELLLEKLHKAHFNKKLTTKEAELIQLGQLIDFSKCTGSSLPLKYWYYWAAYYLEGKNITSTDSFYQVGQTYIKNCNPKDSLALIYWIALEPSFRFNIHTYTILDSLYHKLSETPNKTLQEPITLLNNLLTKHHLYNSDFGKAEIFLQDFEEKINFDSIPFTFWKIEHLFNRIFLEVYQSTNLEKALVHIKLAEEFINSLDDPYLPRAKLNYWLALINYSRKDLERSALYYKNSIKAYLKDDEHYYSQTVGGAYNNLGIIQSDLKNYQEAEKYFQRALENYSITNKSRPNTSTALTYINLAKLYQRQGQLKEAKTYIEKSISTYLSIKTNSSQAYLAQPYFILGQLEKSGKRLISAKKYLEKSLEKAETKISKNDFYIVSNQIELAEIYLHHKKYSLAEFYLEKMFNNVLGNQPILSFLEEPSLLDTISLKKNLFDGILVKSRLEFSRTKNSKDDIGIIGAYNFVKLAEELLILRVEEVHTLSDQHILLEDSYKTYELGTRILRKAYESNPTLELFEEALQWTEKSKAFGLREMVRDSIRSHTLAESLTTQINSLKERITRNRLRPVMDTLQVFAWEDSLFKLTQSYDSLLFRDKDLVQRIQRDSTFTKLKILQYNLGAEQQMLTYFISESILHRFHIGKEFAHWDTMHLPLNFVELIQRHVSFFSNWEKQREIVKDSANLAHFASKSHNLYKLLVPPKLDSLLASVHGESLSLVVIPDGILGLIPFDWLVIKEPNLNEYPRFRQLDFLGNFLPIHFEYSAAYKTSRKENKFLAKLGLGSYAPSYGSGSIPSSERGLPSQRVMDNVKGMNPGYPIKELVYNQEETQKISRLLDSKMVSGPAATRAHFKQEAPNYDILHLSMHGYSDPEDPKLSGLIFSPCKEGQGCEGKNIREEDLHEAILYAFEIENLDLNARLIVLSACQTGIGKIQKGEGVMSLARAFALAGVPSQIVSLWNVDDQATLLLFTKFYKHLLAGDSKNVALWKAKQALKTDPKYSHPYFWAAFVLIGDESPMPDIKPAGLWQKWGIWIALVGMCILLTVIMLKRLAYSTRKAD